MIDLHSHVLPGIDDGPRSLEGSLEMLRDARADGITRLAATPHVRADWPTAPDAMERLVAALREQDTGVEVLPGGELDLEYLETLDDADLRRFGLGGNPRLLLVEFPDTGWPMQLRHALFRLALRGFRVLVEFPSDTCRNSLPMPAMGRQPSRDVRPDLRSTSPTRAWER